MLFYLLFYFSFLQRSQFRERKKEQSPTWTHTFALTFRLLWVLSFWWKREREFENTSWNFEGEMIWPGAYSYVQYIEFVRVFTVCCCCLNWNVYYTLDITSVPMGFVSSFLSLVLFTPKYQGWLESTNQLIRFSSSRLESRGGFFWILWIFNSGLFV